jgi:hypothetical protein
MDQANLSPSQIFEIALLARFAFFPAYSHPFS